jgi:REP element-mobilizing transposase RayT
MARALRVEFSGAWFHITARGNERRAIFRTDGDRRKFIALLSKLPGRFDLKIHGYVLMTDHYHLLMEIGSMGLSRPMQWLNVSYSVWFNRRHERVGHLFQGRFKAVLVEAERWGWELSRYVHLNPVRIAHLGLGKADRAERRVGLSAASSPQQIAERLALLREFTWSSYHVYLGEEPIAPWLSVDLLGREKTSRRRREARRAYRRYVEEAIREGLPETPWEQVKGQLLLGGASLKRKVQSLLGGDRREQSGVKELRRREFGEVIAVVMRLRGEAWSEFRDRHGDWGRDLALWLGRERCGLPLRELGALAGGIHYAAVSMAIRRWRLQLHKNPRRARLSKRAIKMLNV